MSVQTVWPEVIRFSSCGPISFQTSGELVSPDGGLLLFAQLDEHLGLTANFAKVLDDPRDPKLCDHSILDLVRQRVYGILADYVDQNDAATLANDPIFKLILQRRPDGPRLASQPTLSRFENAINIPSLKRLRELLVRQFLDSFSSAPRHLTIDLDAVDATAHGEQQLTFWHGYYDQNQYYPLLITNAETDQVVMASLRHGSAHGALGTADDLEYLVNGVRQRWPDVVIHVRGDCTFGIPLLCDPCERLGLLYTFGLGSNQVLKRRTQALLERAVATWQSNRQWAREVGGLAQPVRLFDGFWHRAGNWPYPRWVVAKAEANSLGTNQRLVVTNRPGAQVLPEATYNEYGMRGESENRHKELKCDLHMDRLSDHRFKANYFRLYLHTLAMTLLVRMRRLVALPAEQRFTEVMPPEVSPTTVVFAKVASTTVAFTEAAPTTAAFTEAAPTTAAFAEVAPTTAAFAEVAPTTAAFTAAVFTATVSTVAPTAGELAEVVLTAAVTMASSPEVEHTAAVLTAAVTPAAVTPTTVVSTEVAATTAVPLEAPPTEMEPAAFTATILTVAASRAAVSPELIPTEALAGAQRQRHFRQRRQRDVLGEGQPSTWRRLLIKAVAIVTVSRRGFVVRLSENWPHLHLFHQTLQRLIAALTPMTPATN
jgi:hypothetical protein